MVVGSVIKWLGLGLIGAFAILSLSAPQQAFATTQAFGGIGTALSSIGKGTQTFLTGLGTGSAQLLNPLWTLRDLIYGPQAGVQVQKDIEEVTSTGNIANSQITAQQKAIELDPAAPFTPITTGFGGAPLGTPPNSSEQLVEQGAAQAANTTMQGFSYQKKEGFGAGPVAQVTVHGQSLPMSQAAISFYQSLGVQVSPSNSQTVTSQNSANGGSPSAASATYRAGAAQAAGYSQGAPRHG